MSFSACGNSESKGRTTSSLDVLLKIVQLDIQDAPIGYLLSLYRARPRLLPSI